MAVIEEVGRGTLQDRTLSTGYLPTPHHSRRNINCSLILQLNGKCTVFLRRLTSLNTYLIKARLQKLSYGYSWKIALKPSTMPP